MTKKKSEPNPIEGAIGDRAKTPEVLDEPRSEFLNKTPSEILNEPSPPEMLTLEELNHRTVDKLEDKWPEGNLTQEEKRILDQRKSPIPVSKPDPLPVTKTSSQESPPQKIDKEFHPVAKPIANIEKLPPDFKIKHTYDTGIAGAIPNENAIGALDDLVRQEIPDVGGVTKIQPAEDIELTALRKYILEDGFVVATVAFHIVSLCAQPMTTPSTTMWDYKDRAMIPDMVLALLNQPGYIEGIWPSLKIVMASNKGNAAWSAGIATTIAFFDTVRMLPVLKELKNESI